MASNRKRSNGEGSIYREKSGRFRIAVTYKTANGKTKRKTRIAWTKTEAVNALAELRAAAPSLTENESASASGEMLLADYFDFWLDTVVASQCEPTTLDNYRRTSKCHIVARLGHWKVNSLTPIRVQKWLSQMASDEIGSRTRQNAFIVLSAAMSKAVSFGLRDKDPCVGISKPKHSTKKMEPFTLDECKRLLAAADTKKDGALIHVAIHSGARIGELFGLRRSDVLWESNSIRIEQQAVMVGSRKLIKAPKSESSVRVIDLPPSCMEVLRTHIDSSEPHDLVFPAAEGGLRDRSTFRARFWKPLLAKAGLKYRGVHNTRHTHATLAIGAGVPITVVSQRLGHARVSTTLDIYSHVLDDHVEQSSQKMAALFASTLPPVK